MAGEDPFVLIARVRVKEGMVDQYLEIADEADKAVEESEPGMLFHNFDSDPDDPLVFCWTEVYQNSEALLAHVANPPVGTYVEKHAELADDLSLEIYGDISQEVTDTIAEMGVPMKHFQRTRVGYIRHENFS